MADNMSDIIEPMDFHPCDTPRGMLYYDMSILTKEQQVKLNTLKIETAREDQKYLAAHPEIRACVALLTRQVLKQMPRINIHDAIAEYFAKSRVDIESDIKEYLAQRGPRQNEATSALNLFPPKESESYSYLEEEEEQSGLDDLFDIDEMLLQAQDLWRDQSSDVDTATLDMDISDSFENEGENQGNIPAGLRSGEVTPKAPQAKHSVTIRESLDAREPSSSSQEEGVYNLGHIPTIEDYDAGYGKRRQTYISDNNDDEMEDVPDEVIQYLKDTQGSGGEKLDQLIEEVALEPARESLLSEDLLLNLKASKPHVSTVSELKAKKSQNVEGQESMKALMEKRSVRISVVPSEQLKKIEDEFQKKKVHTSVKKDTKEPIDETTEEAKTVRVSVTAPAERSDDAHIIFAGAAAQNQSTPNMLFAISEGGEEEYSENEAFAMTDEQVDSVAMYETTTEVSAGGETTVYEENQASENTTEEN